MALVAEEVAGEPPCLIPDQGVIAKEEKEKGVGGRGGGRGCVGTREMCPGSSAIELDYETLHQFVLLAEAGILSSKDCLEEQWSS